MISRQEAYELVKGHVKEDYMVKHMLAVEAVMRALARHFGEDEEKWGIAGLLHDLDYVEAKSNFSRHGYITVKMLEEKGLDIPDEVKKAIIAHVGHPNHKRRLLIERAIYPSDPVTGFIVAAAKVMPDKKLASVDVPFLLKRFKEKRFAKGANRKVMKACEDIGLSLEEFLGIALEAMKGISDELGL